MHDRIFALAIDGGQSSTLALVADDTGRILAAGRGGSVGHITEPGGRRQYEDALRDSAYAALSAAGLEPADVTHICLGMTGAMNESGEIVAALFPAAAVASYHDVITALAGASVARPGVVVISGTGAIAYGRLADGREARSSGWGYAIGDEGSGYWLGIEAMRAACKASDGRGAATALTERIPRHLHAVDMMDLHRRLYAQQIPRPDIASVAAVVGAAAADGDAVAQELLARAGAELALAALAVVASLDQIDSGLPVYVTGGVFRAGPLIVDSLRQTIATRSPASRVYSAAYSPVVGALLLALQAAGVALTEQVIGQISATLPGEAVLKRFERV